MDKCRPPKEKKFRFKMCWMDMLSTPYFYVWSYTYISLVLMVCIMYYDPWDVKLCHISMTIDVELPPYLYSYCRHIMVSMEQYYIEK